jgi:hypothetical protein
MFKRAEEAEQYVHYSSEIVNTQMVVGYGTNIFYNSN